MSEEILGNGQVEHRPNARPQRVYGGMWGIPEIAALGTGLLAMLVFILIFALLVVPAQRELDANKKKRSDLEKELQTMRSRYGTMTTAQDHVAKLRQSAEDFELRALRSETEAKVALYQRLNGLMAALNLTNTSGPDYEPLEIQDQARNQTADNKSGRSKLISIFPGVFVSVTVEGSYQNLRRFIRELESGNEFVVISTVELEPSESKEKKEDITKPPTPVPANAAQKTERGKTRGETVTLRMELAGYYRRAGFSPAAATTGVQ